jgi:hypothetical protein
MRQDQLDFLQSLGSLQGGTQEAQLLLDNVRIWEEIKAKQPKKRNAQEAQEDEVHTQMGLLLTADLPKARRGRIPQPNSSRGLTETYLFANGPTTKPVLISMLMEKRGFDRETAQKHLFSTRQQLGLVIEGYGDAGVWSLPVGFKATA